MLFRSFDRLLLLAKGGKTVYFGDIGQNLRTLIEYFKRKSGLDCSPEENPAEWILDQVSLGQHSSVDWPQEWQDSRERAEVRHRLDEMEHDLSKLPVDEHKHLTTFATPFWYQTYLVTLRCFEQYWRTPSYLYSKCALCILPVSLSLLLVVQVTIADILSTLDTLHRFFIFQSRKHDPGSPKPDVRCLHANDHLRQPGPANHAPVLYTACSVRNSRATVEIPFLAIIYCL
jgi:hypothetical protein